MPDTTDSEQDTITTLKSRKGDLHALNFNSFHSPAPKRMCLWENWSLMSLPTLIASDSVI